MNTTLLIKAVIGAAVVVLIQILASTKNYFAAALVPLFPFFGLIAYYIVATQRGVNDLKTSILFGMLSLIPYLTFLIVLYFEVSRAKIEQSLMIASLSWVLAASLIIVSWKNFSHL